MLSRLNAQAPFFLRVSLTAMSALAVIVAASAFTLVPSSPAMRPSSPVRASVSSTLSVKNTQSLHSQTASAHQLHMAHLSHLAHLKYLAEKAAAARYAAAHPVTVARIVTPAHSSQAVASPVTYQGSSSVQQCIISRESGGNSQIWNASGHYGLYQFSYGTWVAHGGNGADFGHASVAEQNQVFANTVAADGYSDWAPYDGC